MFNESIENKKFQITPENKESPFNVDGITKKVRSDAEEAKKETKMIKAETIENKMDSMGSRDKKIEEKLNQNTTDIEALEKETEEKIAYAEKEKNPEKKKEVINESARKRNNILKKAFISAGLSLVPGGPLATLMYEGYKGNIPSWVSNGMDYVPFLGGFKMTQESIQGSAYDGRKIEGNERVVHGIVGASSFFADFSVVGGTAERAAAKGGLTVAEKGGLFAGKSAGYLEKGSALMVKKGDTRGADFLAKSSEFLKNHPELTRQVEERADNWVKDQIKNMVKKKLGEKNETEMQERKAA